MPVIFPKKCPYFSCLRNNIGNKTIRLGTNKTRWMSQETNSTVYLREEEDVQHWWLGVRWMIVCISEFSEKCLSVLTEHLWERKQKEGRGPDGKNRETQTGGTKKKTKTHQTRMPRTLPLILSWAKRRHQSSSVTQKKTLQICVFYLLCHFLAPGREEEKHFRWKHSLPILPLCVFL